MTPDKSSTVRAMSGESTESRPEGLASLIVYSETSAEELAQRLGLEPDEMWNMGELNKRGTPHVTTAISYGSALPRNAPPGDHLADLLTRVESLVKQLRAEAERGNSVRLRLAVFEDADNIMFTVPPELLTRVAKLGIELEFDIYAV
jgi:Domain of unknown function (DUF4279)